MNKVITACIIMMFATGLTCLQAADMGAYIDSTDGSSAFIIYDAASNEIMRANSDGAIGILKSPASELDINGTCHASNFVGNGAGLVGLADLTDIKNVIWVSKSGTPAGPGTIENPFDSVQAAYDTAAIVYSNAVSAIAIAAGNYGALSMHTGSVHVIGISSPVLAGLSVDYSTRVMPNKQRIENIVVDGPAPASVNGIIGAKFHNVRFLGGFLINTGTGIEFQDCFFTTSTEAEPLRIGTGSQEIGVYQSSLLVPETGMPGLDTIVVEDNVNNLEIIGCEIVNREPTATGDCIDDRQSTPLASTVTPAHLYTHNYIKRTGNDVNGRAILEAQSNTIACLQNSIYGDLGPIGSQNTQMRANNVVYGTIYWPASAQFTSQDSQGNSIYNQLPSTLPNAWKD